MDESVQTLKISRLILGVLLEIIGPESRLSDKANIGYLVVMQVLEASKVSSVIPVKRIVIIDAYAPKRQTGIHQQPLAV